MNDKTAIDGSAICKNANLDVNAPETQQPKQSIQSLENELANEKTKKLILADAVETLIETLKPAGRQKETTGRTDIVVNDDQRFTASPATRSRFSDAQALTALALIDLRYFDDVSESDWGPSWTSISKNEIVRTGWGVCRLVKDRLAIVEQSSRNLPQQHQLLCPFHPDPTITAQKG